MTYWTLFAQGWYYMGMAVIHRVPRKLIHIVTQDNKIGRKHQFVSMSQVLHTKPRFSTLLINLAMWNLSIQDRLHKMKKREDNLPRIIISGNVIPKEI